MIKILLLAFLVCGLPIGCVVARLLWRWGNLKLQAAENRETDRYLKGLD